MEESSYSFISGSFLVLIWFLVIFFLIFLLISYIKVFQKAGYSGWCAIIPVYGTIVYLRIAKMSGWYIILLFLSGIAVRRFNEMAIEDIMLAKASMGLFILWISAILIQIVLNLIMNINFARSFGKSDGFGVGIAFLPIVFIPILAFGNSEYMDGSSGNERYNYNSDEKIEIDDIF